MKKANLVIFVLMLSNALNSQNVNYFNYHDYINKAEVFYFLENNVDSSMFYYRKAFKEFDYVFVRDPLIAAQIALYNQKPFSDFLIKGFEVGLKFEHLSNIPIFKDVYSELTSDKSLIADYKVRREKYLKSLNFPYRLQLCKEFVGDQWDKRKPNYAVLRQERMTRLINEMYSKGFPGAKIIGIDDKTMFSEIGKPEFDADSIFRNYGKGLTYLKVDDIFTTKYIMVILYHELCSYSILEKSFNDLIIKGEIHPREVGFIFDRVFVNTRGVKFECRKPDGNLGVYKLNNYWHYPNVNCTPERIDSLRKTLHIVPVKVDKAKKEYEKLGFRTTFGYYDCL